MGLHSDDRAAPACQAIVLDADQRSALAVTRSLGRHQVRVIVADKKIPTLAGSSKFSCGAFQYPTPAVELSAFIATLAALGPFAEAPVLIACTDETLPAIIGAATALQRFVFCVPSADAYHRLSDKWALYDLAQRCDVPVPVTSRLAPGVRSIGHLSCTADQLVIKPRQSVLDFGTSRVKLPVIQLAKAMLPALLAGGAFPDQADLLVQDVVPGWGVGVSVVCDQGKVVAWFAHRRLREQPPAGGVSVYCESIALPPELRRYCAALIEATSWHGPAMFEFKMDATGAAHLIEVNGRLWGSVQLAIDCGVDIPLLMYRLARGEAVAHQDGYAIGRRLRWLIGDLSHLYLVLRGKGVNTTTPSRLRTLFDVMCTDIRRTSVEDWRYGDYRPFW